MGINPENLNAGNIRRSIAVSSPVSGYISSVNVKIGQYVSPTDRLFEVVNTDDVHLALSVLKKDLNKISVGQRVLPTPIKIQKKICCQYHSHRKRFSAR
jgi:cobalt-zinc-cadmium efflux system membrane fusion protein